MAPTALKNIYFNYKQLTLLESVANVPPIFYCLKSNTDYLHKWVQVSHIYSMCNHYNYTEGAQDIKQTVSISKYNRSLQYWARH